MPRQVPISPDDPLVIALRASARVLEADPEATIQPAFQRSGRAVLLGAIAARAPARPPRSSLAWRLVSVGVAALIFVALSVPALAGPTVMVEVVTSAARAIVVTGLPIGDLVLDWAVPTAQGMAAPQTPPAARQGSAVAALVPPAATAEATQGAWPRASARDDHGAPATPMPPTPTSAPVAPTTTPARPTNHGAAVVDSAQASPTPGQPRGQQAREGARDNGAQHRATATSIPAPAVGRGKSEEKPTAPTPGKPSTPPGHSEPGRPADPPGAAGRDKPDEPPGNPNPGPPATPPTTPDPGPPGPPPKATPEPPKAPPKPAKPDPAPKPAPKPGNGGRDNGKGGGNR